jgi:hypothetical protein
LTHESKSKDISVHFSYFNHERNLAQIKNHFLLSPRSYFHFVFPYSDIDSNSESPLKDRTGHSADENNNDKKRGDAKQSSERNVSTLAQLATLKFSFSSGKQNITLMYVVMAL